MTLPVWIRATHIHNPEILLWRCMKMSLYFIYIYKYIYICIYVCICKHMHIYMHTRAYICTHIHISLMYICVEKAMASHSSTVAWKIPWTEEPGGLESMGSLRAGHDWATPLSLFTFMHWRRKWQPTPVFLPGESQGWGSLVGCCLSGLTESDTTEAT